MTNDQLLKLYELAFPMSDVYHSDPAWMARLFADLRRLRSMQPDQAEAWLVNANWCVDETDAWSCARLLLMVDPLVEDEPEPAAQLSLFCV